MFVQSDQSYYTYTGQEKHVPVHMAVIVISYIVSLLGIIWTTVCLIFNIVFRNKKYECTEMISLILSSFYRIVKLSSPNLNYLIIVGSYFLYFSVYLLLFPDVQGNYEIFCNVISERILMLSNDDYYR